VCGDAQADVMWSELACSEASMYPTVTSPGGFKIQPSWVDSNKEVAGIIGWGGKVCGVMV